MLIKHLIQLVWYSTSPQFYGYTPLHVACLYEQQRVVSELLKKLRSDPKGVNIQDKV